MLKEMSNEGGKKVVDKELWVCLFDVINSRTPALQGEIYY